MFYLLIFFLFAGVYCSTVQNNALEFQHNFCESRLQENQPPELFNAYSSLIISLVPFLTHIPKNQIFTNVSYCFIINGFASFYYHYYLSWFGKQADEIIMILCNYFGLCGLIKMNYANKNNRKLFYLMNICFMYFFLIINTFTKYDMLFPHLFLIYLLPTIYLVNQVAIKIKQPYVFNLLLSGFGGFCWVISENICNHYTKYGHVLWHFLFPLGFYRLLLKFDANYKTSHASRPIKSSSLSSLNL